MITTNILHIDTCSRLMHVPDPHFWLDLLKNATVTYEFSLNVCKLVAALCSNVDVGADILES